LAASPVLEARAAVAAVRLIYAVEIAVGARRGALRGHWGLAAISAGCGSITTKRVACGESGDTGKHGGARLLQELTPVQRTG